MSGTGPLASRVAVITGAARGQGRAVAARLARDGADVVLLDICHDIDGLAYPLATADDLAEAARLAAAHGGRVMSIVADVRDPDALAAACARVVDEWGSVDILHANAAILNQGAILDLPQRSWLDMIEVTLGGVWNTVRAFAPPMVRQGRGSIVVTSSVNGREGGIGLGAYVAAKHGVLGLAKSLALELGRSGIRVNSVLPGPVNTPMANNPPTREWVVGRPATEQEFLAASRSWHALSGSEAADPDRVAAVVAWLAGDESAHLTGVEIPVDAGHLILPGTSA